METVESIKAELATLQGTVDAQQAKFGVLVATNADLAAQVKKLSDAAANGSFVSQEQLDAIGSQILAINADLAATPDAAPVATPATDAANSAPAAEAAPAA